MRSLYPFVFLVFCVSASMSAAQTATLDQELARLKAIPLHGEYADTVEAFRDEVFDYIYDVRATVPAYAQSAFDLTINGDFNDYKELILQPDALGTIALGGHLRSIYQRYTLFEDRPWPSAKRKAQQDAQLLAIEQHLTNYLADMGARGGHASNDSFFEAFDFYFDRFTQRRIYPFVTGYGCDISSKQRKQIERGGEKILEFIAIEIGKQPSILWGSPTPELFWAAVNLEDEYYPGVFGPCMGRPHDFAQAATEAFQAKTSKITEITSRHSERISQRLEQLRDEQERDSDKLDDDLRALDSMVHVAQYRARDSHRQLLSVLYAINLWYALHQQEADTNQQTIWQDLEAQLVSGDTGAGTLEFLAQLQVGINPEYLWCAIPEVRIIRGEAWAMSELEGFVLIVNRRTGDFQVRPFEPHASITLPPAHLEIPYTCQMLAGEPNQLCEGYEFEDVAEVMKVLSIIRRQRTKHEQEGDDTLTFKDDKTAFVFAPCERDLIVVGLAALKRKNTSTIEVTSTVAADQTRRHEIDWWMFWQPLVVSLSRPDIDCDEDWDTKWRIDLTDEKDTPAGRANVLGEIEPMASVQRSAGTMTDSEILQIAASSPIIQSRQLRIQLDELLQAETDEQALAQWEQEAAALSQKMNKKYLSTAQVLLDDARATALLRLGDVDGADQLFEQNIQRIEEYDLEFDAAAYRYAFKNQRRSSSVPLLGEHVVVPEVPAVVWTPSNE